MDYSSGKYLKLSELIQNDTSLVNYVPTINDLSDGNTSSYVFEVSSVQIVDDGITARDASLTYLTLTHNVNSVSPSSANIFYGVCTTAAGTAAKTVTINTTITTDSILSIGTILFVTFSNTNSASVSSITLNVNGTGAKGIRKIKNASVSTLAAAGELQANCTYMFTYYISGSTGYWVCMTLDYNSTYTVPTLNSGGTVSTQYYLMGTPSTIGTTLYRYGTNGPYMVGNQLYAGSDLAYKKDITPISNDFVNQLFEQTDITYDFTWKDSNSNSSGFIAQWIEDIMPEVVNGEDGEKHVNYDAALSKVVGAMFKKIQEQQNQIDELIKQNKEIKKELENIHNTSEK